MPEQLETMFRDLISGIYVEQYGSYDESILDDNDDILKSRRAIKEKAMKDEVAPARYLENIADRKARINQGKEGFKTNPNSTKKEGKPKKRSCACELGWVRKRMLPICPRAFKTDYNTSKWKKSKNIPSLMNVDDVNECHNNVDSDAVCSKQSISSKEMSEEMKKGEEKAKQNDKEENAVDDEIATFIENKRKNNQKHILEKVADLNAVKEAIKLAAAANIKNKMKSSELITTEEGEEQESNIDIDILPGLIITEEQGKLFEIEIIDYKKPSNKPLPKPMKTYKRKETGLRKISSLPGITLEKIANPDNQSDIEPVPSTSDADQLVEIIEID